MPEYWKGIIDLNPRIRHIQIHSVPMNITPPDYALFSKIFFYRYCIKDETNCGNICPQYFNTNIDLFTESMQFNTCLNRKVSVDRMGLIKNCPSMTKDFGHISINALSEAIHKDSFRTHWKIKKDDITVCKDCEFRHMCTDCRTYLFEPENILSKPLKCGYDPYTASWTQQEKESFALKRRHL